MTIKQEIYKANPTVVIKHLKEAQMQVSKMNCNPGYLHCGLTCELEHLSLALDHAMLWATELEFKKSNTILIP